MKVFYLSGGMEYAADSGRGWRKELTDFITRELKREVFNPVEVGKQLLSPITIEEFRTLKEKDLSSHLKYVKRFIENDLHQILNHTEAVICYWDDSARRGAGTQAEITFAYWKGIPVYLVTELPLTEISSWVLACCSETFSSFRELKAYLLRTYSKKGAEMSKKRYLLSMDGGGTKTEVLTVDLLEKTFFKTTAGGSNYSVYGDKGLDTIRDLINQSADHFQISPEELDGLALGLAGYSADIPRNKLKELLKSLKCEEQSFLITDAHLALYSIFKTDPGIVVIAGTGSICLGKDESGKIYRAGGYGWMVGDEGSGYWLGQMAMRRLLMIRNENDRENRALSSEIKRQLQVNSIEEAARLLTTAENPHAMIASLSQAVNKALAAGDEIALEIVSQGGELLANTVLQLCEKMKFSGNSLSIGYSGSVIENNQHLRDSLKVNLEYFYPNIYLKPPASRPILGGIYYLIEKLNLKNDLEWLQLNKQQT